jgi:hypothetical protein
MHRLARWSMALFATLGATLAAAESPSTSGLPPWHFQMTPEEVTSFADYGPYQSFRNGDLETHAGLFNGRKENVQFFFRDGKLARIGIYLYEGQDAKAAANTWGNTYSTLKASFGDIELPGIRVESDSQALAPEAVAAAGGANVATTGKDQMAPVHQPADKFVVARFTSANVQGQMFYFVAVFYDPPRR